MSITPGPNSEELKAAQRQVWSDSARAWRKWYPQFVVQGRGLTDAMAAAGQVKPGMRILDLASGSGEPAITLARMVGPQGHVTATDLVSDMVAVAEDNAREAGLTNMSFKQADAESLPFPDQSFDVVTCRNGIMFCPDVALALRETYRVLKPGGRVVLIVWGPPNQPYFASTLGVFSKYVQLPPPVPGAPGPFRFAQPGSLSAEMRLAGFQPVHEETATIPFPFPGTPEEAWAYARELTNAAFQRIFEALTPEKREQAISEVLAAIRQYYDGSQVNFVATVVLATGMR